MRVLSVGAMDGVSNTCRFRNMAMERIADHVDVVDTSAPLTLWFRIAYHLFLYGMPVKLPDQVEANNIIRRLIDNYKYDIVWIDKGVTITPGTLQYVKGKQPNVKLVSYSPDNMSLRHNQSYQYVKGIPYYDYHLTVYRPGLEDSLKGIGAKRVIFLNKGFEPSFHHPYELTEDEKQFLGGEIGFIGTWEKERCESILYLVDHGLRVKVWGGGQWNRYKDYNPNLTISGCGLKDENYVKAINAFRINLCFVRHLNNDTYTSRTYEIPASGGFMMAECTDEHLKLFKEDKEAVFFGSNTELYDKCIYYLDNEKERQDIAKAGLKRCYDSHYSNEGMIRMALKEIGMVL